MYYNLNFLFDGTLCQDFATSLTTSVLIFLSSCLSIFYLICLSSFFVLFSPLSGHFFRVLWSFFVIRIFKIVMFLWLYKLFYSEGCLTVHEIK